MKSASCTLSSVLPLSKSGNLDKLRLSYLMQQSLLPLCLLLQLWQ